MDSRLTQLKSILRSSATSEDDQRQLVAQLMKDSIYSDFDEGYLRALLFPEYAPAVRIPTPFGIPSTLTTQRFSFYVNTGQGDGFIAFLPQDLSFRSCFRSMSGISSDSVNYPRWEGVNTKLHCVIPVPESDFLNIQNAFTSIRVVGASIRIGYTGTVDQEQGFMVGAHVYDKRVCELSEKAIEDGYYVTRTRPSDGIRLVYQPKDESDFQYQEINRRWSDGAVASTITETFYNAQAVAQPVVVNVYQPSDILLGGTAAKDQLDETPAYREYMWKLNQNMAVGAEYGVGTQNYLNWVQLTAQSEAQRLPIEQMWGMGPRTSQGGACPQILVAYYKGLPENQECLRVDVIRHLECVPRTAIKDIVAVSRPTANEESLKVATKIGPMAPVCQSSTLSAAESVKDHVSDVMSSSGTAKDFLKGIGRRLNPGSWKGPLGEVGRQAIVGASGVLLGPEVLPFSEAGMQFLKKTSGGDGGPGSMTSAYNQKPNQGLGADALKFFKGL